jgi:hypothetical protein
MQLVVGGLIEGDQADVLICRVLYFHSLPIVTVGITPQAISSSKGCVHALLSSMQVG